MLARLRPVHARGRPAVCCLQPAQDGVALDARAVREVEQKSPVAIAVGDVSYDRQAMREHHGVAHGIADRDIVRELAVVGVHVMNGEAEIAKSISAEHVLATGDRKIPSRPYRKLLSSTFAPGASQTETPLPASFMRPFRILMISLLRTTASGAPWI